MNASQNTILSRARKIKHGKRVQFNINLLPEDAKELEQQSLKRGLSKAKIIYDRYLLGKQIETGENNGKPTHLSQRKTE